MDQTYMKEKPVLSLLLSMSLPMVISMAVSSLYNIIDSYFIARINEDALTALSLVYPMQNLVNAVTIGFGIGVNSVISFHLGAGNQKEADEAATQGFFFSLIQGILLTVFCLISMRPFLSLFTSDEAVLSYGLEYSHIVFSFSIIVSLSMTSEKIYQAVGKMSVAMTCVMTGCITNIVLDPLLIFGIGPFPEMGIRGAAIATGIGQSMTMLVYVIIYFARPLSVHLKGAALKKINIPITKKIYAVGIPAMLNLALASVLISVLNAILSAYSQIYVIVLGVYYKLQTFLYLPANGVIQGMRPLIGYNYGANEQKRVRKILLDTLLLTGLIMAAGTVLCQLIPETLIGLFSENPETIKAGGEALRIISCGFLVSAVSVTCCGALEGLGRGLPSLAVSLCRYLILILPAAWLLTRTLGPDAVWHAFWITESLAAVISAVIIYFSMRDSTRSLSSNKTQPPA